MIFRKNRDVKKNDVSIPILKFVVIKLTSEKRKINKRIKKKNIGENVKDPKGDVFSGSTKNTKNSNAHKEAKPMRR